MEILPVLDSFVHYDISKSIWRQSGNNIFFVAVQEESTQLGRLLMVVRNNQTLRLTHHVQRFLIIPYTVGEEDEVPRKTQTAYKTCIPSGPWSGVVPGFSSSSCAFWQLVNVKFQTLQFCSIEYDILWTRVKCNRIFLEVAGKWRQYSWN